MRTNVLYVFRQKQRLIWWTHIPYVNGRLNRDSCINERSHEVFVLKPSFQIWEFLLLKKFLYINAMYVLRLMVHQNIYSLRDNNPLLQYWIWLIKYLNYNFVKIKNCWMLQNKDV